MRATQKPLILVGAILLGLAGLASIDNLVSLPGIFNWLTSPENAFVPATVIDIVSMLAITLGSIGLAIWAFFAKNPKSLGIPAIILAVVGGVFALGLNVYWITQGTPFLEAFFQTYAGFGREVAASAAFISLIGAGLLALGALTAKPVAPVAPAATATPVGAAAFDPMTGQPIAPAAPAGQAQSNLPLLALIFGIVAPLVGIIIGHIALGQMKRGEISRVNESQAKTGLILGYVLTGLSIVGAIIWFIIMAVWMAAITGAYSGY